MSRKCLENQWEVNDLQRIALDAYWKYRDLVIWAHRKSGKSRLLDMIAVEEAVLHNNTNVAIATSTYSYRYYGILDLLNRVGIHPTYNTVYPYKILLSNGSSIQSAFGKHTCVRPNVVLVEEAKYMGNDLYEPLFPMLYSTRSMVWVNPKITQIARNPYFVVYPITINPNISQKECTNHYRYCSEKEWNSEYMCRVVE